MVVLLVSGKNSRLDKKKQLCLSKLKFMPELGRYIIVLLANHLTIVSFRVDKYSDVSV